MADKRTSGNGNGNGSSSHEYINEAGIGNADDEDYCKKVLKLRYCEKATKNSQLF